MTSAPSCPHAVRTEGTAYPPRAPGPFSIALGAVVREIPDAVLADPAAAAVRVTGVHHDSRRVEPGDLFVARAGGRARGESFIADALARGARAVLVERGSDASTGGAPRVEAADVPRALALAAAAVYGHPTFALEVAGITGTNGKTTTAHLVQAAIDAAGRRAGIVGTLGYRFEGLSLPPTHTSPEADDLARVAAQMRARGASHLVMEVSSIALVAKRCDAVHFRVAAFTNLTQDHLDYHGTMEAYAAAKDRLFFDLAPGSAAVNVDDPHGASLARRLSGAVPLVRFSARAGAGRDAADVAPTAIAHTRAGIEITARTPAGPVTIRSSLVGAHNVENLLAALSIAHLFDLDLAVVARALSIFRGVPGRLERCDTPGEDDVIALVDYAHTPDALDRVLASIRALGTGRVRCVFGCGGDRDPDKRPKMGEAVGRGADVAILTNDNPRGEDPEAIAAAVLPGLAAGKAEVVVELDRRRAIERAVVDAAPGDVILVAGKGHEPYQILGAMTLPFDDRDEVRRALALRRERAAG
jgi:UDP-N-acetylmuramoyl-L-alanyl-D-glutamate--2,6-diaminopimelate ligase